MISYYAIFLFGFYSTIKRRHYQPIKGRGYLLNSISLIGGNIMTSVICIREYNIEEFPCWVYILSINAFFTLFFYSYLFRILEELYIHYNANNISDSIFNTGNIKNNLRGFNKKYFWILYIIGIICSIIFTMFMIIYGYISKNIEFISDGCSLSIEWIPFCILSFGYILCYTICFIALKCFKNGKDLFGIRSELLQCMIVWAPLTIIFFVLNLYEPLHWINSYFPASLIAIIMIIYGHFISIIRPLILSHTFQGIETEINIKKKYKVMKEFSEINKDLLDLREIWSNDELKEIFCKWLLSHFNTLYKYAEFLNDIYLYKIQCLGDKRKEVSKEIWSTYFDKNNEKNITDQIEYRKIETLQTQIFSSCSHTNLFEECEDSILEFLAKTTISHFKASAKYAKFTRICKNEHYIYSSYDEEKKL